MSSYSLNYGGVCLASDAQFSDFLGSMGPAQFVGRQTLATTPMGECPKICAKWGFPAEAPCLSSLPLTLAISAECPAQSPIHTYPLSRAWHLAWSWFWSPLGWEQRKGMSSLGRERSQVLGGASKPLPILIVRRLLQGMWRLACRSGMVNSKWTSSRLGD